MTDGLYQVTTSYLCAGFVIQDNEVIKCAPILKRKLSYWKTIAIRIPRGSAGETPACMFGKPWHSRHSEGE